MDKAKGFKTNKDSKLEFKCSLIYPLLFWLCAYTGMQMLPAGDAI